MPNNIEISQFGIKCDNPECDFRDNSVQEHEYANWLNVPCPKCGQNLLTEEDFSNAELLKFVADLVNTLSPEEILAIHKSGNEELKKSPMFKDTKGLELLDSEKNVIMSAETHKGIRFTEIREDNKDN